MVSKQVMKISNIYKIPHNKSFNTRNLVNGVFPVINHLPHNKSINPINMINCTFCF